MKLIDETQFRDFKEKSHNVAGYHECIEFWPDEPTRRQHYSRHDNQKDCEANKGMWTQLFGFIEKAPGKMLYEQKTIGSASK